MIILKIKLSFILLLILVLNACDSKQVEENQLKPVELVDSIDTQSPTAYDRYAQYKTTFAFDPLPLKDSTVQKLRTWINGLDEKTKEELWEKRIMIWVTYNIANLQLNTDKRQDVYDFHRRVLWFLNSKIGYDHGLPTIIFVLDIYKTKLKRSTFNLELIHVDKK